MIGRISFDLNGVSHTLHFGMLSAQIFAEKGVKEVLILQDGQDARDSDTKTLATIIHAGACNYAEISEQAYPSFEESYDLMESICLTGSKLQNDIFKCWQDSQPTVSMFERLKGALTDQKKSKKGTRTNGKKSEPLHTA